MNVRILSAGPLPGHPLTGFVIDDTLAVDAGPLGHALSVDEQTTITDVLLTHAHIDHVAGLPIFLDNVYQACPGCPTVHALPYTLDVLQRDLFNGRLMPDFIGMSRTLPPFVRTSVVQPNVPFRVGKYTITAVPLDHTIPTVGYVIDDGTDAVAVVTDTAPVPGVLERIAKMPRLTAVFLECSFPRRMAELAAVSRHLTTDQFADAAHSFPPGVSVRPIHIKPRYFDEIAAELKELGFKAIRGECLIGFIHGEDEFGEGAERVAKESPDPIP